MGAMKLSELEVGSQITLLIHNKNNKMEIKGVIKRHIVENVVLISLEYESTKRLIFDGVIIDMEYCHENEVPYIWHKVKIANYKNDYGLVVC